MGTGTDLVWYASYGSNMHAERFRCYLEGGVPPGGRRACPGCRDPRPPRRAAGHLVPGGVYFATESRVWGGGRAFFDPDLPGSAALRAYLITTGQFADVVAQEMYREPGTDLDLREVLDTGRCALGPGRYETLLRAGDLDGHPVLTFTAPWSSAEVAPRAPSAPYLRVILAGLRTGQGWDLGTAAAHLAAMPGARGRWAPSEIAALAG
ncbi:histone deacetylase [Saccharopolyspora sp. MS10]|uniref:histone deacetylase n=1 Tax=Saccharopolyspora sp. MS10 TaxID=3385973 RepID=UPI0039A11877